VRALQGDERARDLLDRYLTELAHWGAHTNLVGSLDRAALEVHVRDSLAAAPELPAGASVVDLGSGAGFPGLPVAIARPDLRVTLLEIRERRVSFLRHVTRTLGLSCEVVRGRIETPSATPFDYALARAVAAAAELIPIARPWVGGKGEVWIWGRVRASEVAAPDVSEIPLEEGRGWILRVPGAEQSPSGRPR